MNGFVVTLDIDWVPDYVIDHVAGILKSAGVKATWLVTHSSPAIDRLAAESLFELGIHPNFMAGSSHGADARAVLDHCAALVPGARSMRTHGLMQSSRLLAEIASTTSVRVDSSICMPYVAGIRPFVYETGSGPLVRIPFVWADDLEMADPRCDWRLAPLAGIGPGLKVLNFHPIHVFLNSSNPEVYGELKRAVPRLEELPQDRAESARASGRGTATLFAEVADALRGTAMAHLGEVDELFEPFAPGVE